MDGYTIAIDTREQRPYEFPGAVVMTLPTGDYSIVGLEHRVAIERKSKADAYGSLGQGRARFRRECERLAALDYAAIVVEDTVPGFLRRPAHSKMNPRSAIGSLLAWSSLPGPGVLRRRPGPRPGPDPQAPADVRQVPQGGAR